MRKPRFPQLLLVTLVAVSVACSTSGGGTTEPPPTDTQPPPPTQVPTLPPIPTPPMVPTAGGGGAATVTLINQSGQSVCYVHISLSTEQYWGDDWLGSTEIVADGATRAFGVEPGTWDMQAQTCDGETIEEEYGNFVGPAGYDWIVEPSAVVSGGSGTFSDDFSSDSGAWSECEECTVSGGQLQMGPWGISGADTQHFAICDACGEPVYYRMSVDLTYIDGVSEPGRGFGLVLGLNNDRLLILEVSPYQSLDVYEFDYETREWTWINGVMTGAVQAEHGTNSVSVEMAQSNPGRADISIGVNGRTPLVIFNQEAVPGLVGLTLFGHSLEVAFDNFEFAVIE